MSHKNKTNNKIKVLIGLIIVLITGICLLYFSGIAGNKNKTKEPAKTFEPTFKKDGELAFIRKSSHDTIKLIDIEVANNETKRTQGMMWRRSMLNSQGMLFVFNSEELRSFWMKNCYIPLDMIFVNSVKTIVSIQYNTEPLREWSYPSEFPAMYVVEVNAGFCHTNKIEIGDSIQYFINY